MNERQRLEQLAYRQKREIELATQELAYAQWRLRTALATYEKIKYQLSLFPTQPDHATNPPCPTLG